MTTKIVISFVFITALAACGNSRQPDKTQPEIPKALADKTISSEVLLKRGSDDLIESLYKELVDKNGDLKSLEDKIQILQESQNDSTRLFDKFNSKNLSYYSATGRYIDQLSDSLLKNKMKTLIANSLVKYKTLTAKYNALLKMIEQRNITLSDLHTVLKITKTLPLIEDFQENNLPSTNAIDNFIHGQNEAITLADTLSNK